MAFPSVDQIVEALRTSRAEFEMFFLQAQQQANIPPGDRQQFELVAADPDDQTAFRIALRVAERGNFLRQFVLIVLLEGLATKELATRVIKASRRKGDALRLHAIVDEDAGFAEPRLMIVGLGNGTKSTARIVIKGKAEGTGVLVEPDRVLTAWHVVRPLFYEQNGAITPRPNSAADLFVEFDDVNDIINGRIQEGTKQRVPVHAEWCVAFSRCHEDELAERIPKPLTKLAGFADYVMIRLAAPQPERPTNPIQANAVVPSINEKLLLMQHPGGGSMKWADGKIGKGPRGLTGLRFLHGANSLGGSSGGPCFDRQFTLIGLHQGAWKNTGSTKKLNRGVPISAVYADLNRPKTPRAVEAPTRSSRLAKESQYIPVFGLADYKTLIAQSADKATPRVIVIAGTEGSGKTFCLKILDDALPVAKHLVVNIGAEVIAKQDAPSIATTIAQLASASLEPVAPAGDYASTPSAWLRDEVVTKLSTALAACRGDRTVWLCLSDLNDYRLEGQRAAELLLLLCEETRRSDWLRIVLDGTTGDLPATIADLAARYELTPIGRKDVEEYLSAVCAELNMRPDAARLSAKLDAIMTEFAGLRTVAPGSALGKLSERVQELLGDMIAKRPKGAVTR